MILVLFHTTKIFFFNLVNVIYIDCSILCNFAGDDKHQEVVLKILYHLSYEEDVKHNFVECIGLVRA